jgi:hypothetical protein
VDQGERVAVDQLGRVVAEHPPDRLAAEPLLAGPQGPLGRLALVDLGGERRVRPEEPLLLGVVQLLDADASRWTLTRLPVRNVTRPKIVVVRLTLT